MPSYFVISEIDVKNDHAGCPPYVCHPCCLRMRKVIRIRQGKQRGLGTAWDVPDWPPVQTSSSSTVPAQEGTSSGHEGPASDAEMTFREAARNICKNYGIIDVSGGKSLTFLTLETVTGNSLFKLEIFEDGTWRLWYRGLLVRVSVPVLSNVPPKLESVDCVETLLDIMKTGSVCAGHRDFPLLAGECAQEGKSILTGHNKNDMVGYYHCVSFRSRNCHVLVTKSDVLCPPSLKLCSSCVHPDFRQSLRSRECYLRTKGKNDEGTVKADSKTPFSHLSPEQKASRLKNLSRVAHNLKHKVQRLQAKLDKMISDEAVDLSPEQGTLMSKLAKENQSKVTERWAENSPQRLLWEQQVKRNSVKGPGGMRWHPTIIRWCLSMYIKSPAAYKQLADSEFLYLPSQSTLKTYSNFTDNMPGVNPEIIKILIKEFNLPNAPAFQTNVSLVWDEMKIRSGLVISKSSGKVIGFTSLDTVSHELGMLSQLGSSKEAEPELATHILVFMVRGLMVHVNLPFMWYPCQGFNADQLWGAVWGATRTLQNLGLSVRAWVCDGATPNRKFFRVHEGYGGKYQRITYYTENRYAPGQRIYFICDVPHLLKTLRNNFENSHGHLNSKDLRKDGLSISWAHVVSTVDEDMSHALNRMPKIREEHIHLSPQLRMRVKLAAQVLSSTMANAIRQRDRPEMFGTAAFCQIMDKWFDCLNGRYLKAPKPNLRPYMANDPNDPRYQWLEDYFLGWLTEWETEINALPGLTQSEKNKFLLSYQTSQGLKITTKSFLDLSRALLAEEGAQFLLPEKLNQDRLEVFFAKLRRGCGDSDNPTVEEARHRIVSLIVAGRQVMAPRNANCVVDEEGEREVFMPKRKQKRK